MTMVMVMATLMLTSATTRFWWQVTAAVEVMVLW